MVRAEESRKLLADWWTETWNACGGDRVRERLGLPDTLLPMAAVYLGPPAKKLTPPRRRPATEVIYREKLCAA